MDCRASLAVTIGLIGVSRDKKSAGEPALSRTAVPF
jgi:hypothetical protein